MSNFVKYPFSRRDILRLSSAGVLASSVSGWFGRFAQAAESQGANGAAGKHGNLPVGGKAKACILLWMNGGPSQHHTFSPPEKDCEYKTIATATAGVQFCEYLPQLAKLMPKMALLRGMSTPEKEHERARSMMHDGRKVIAGETYPAFGSIVSKELGRNDSPIPNFVTIDGGTDGNNGPGFYRPLAAYLGPRHNPLRIADPALGVEFLRGEMPTETFDAGLSLLEKSQRRLAAAYGTGPASAALQAHDAALNRAVALMRSPQAKAFDLARESEATRNSYGDTDFGRGCLMARRLVETGVPFVEVSLAGWDDHGGAGKEVKRRCEYMDGAMAALLGDLESRGLLDSTLVVWMGEFGRSPGKGDGHYSKAWTTLLAGGGVQGGRVIGRTDPTGGTVTERPVGAADFIATLCYALGIDHTKEYESAGFRPMRIAEEHAHVVSELF